MHLYHGGPKCTMTLSSNFEKEKKINREMQSHSQLLERLGLDRDSLCSDSQCQCHPPLGMLFLHLKCLAMKRQNSLAMLDAVLPRSTLVFHLTKLGLVARVWKIPLLTKYGSEHLIRLLSSLHIPRVWSKCIMALATVGKSC